MKKLLFCPSKTKLISWQFFFLHWQERNLWIIIKKKEKAHLTIILQVEFVAKQNKIDFIGKTGFLHFLQPSQLSLGILGFLLNKQLYLKFQRNGKRKRKEKEK